jgi:hypothetical protein
MAYLFQSPVLRFCSLTLLVGLCAGVLVISVSAYGYSEDYTGYLGETIDLHGVSYNSDAIYLFMTGPGLPENGVSLTNPLRKADQGYFTTIDVGSDQQWSFKWDTSKIENEIDPGTYIVYAVNAPVDKSSLDGHSYQTLSVYLQDSDLSKDRISVGANYTLRPGRLTDGTAVTTTMTTVPPTSPPTTAVPETTAMTVTPASTPTQKSALTPFAAILGTVIIGGICIFSRKE